MIIPKTETCNQTESPRFISDAESYYKTALGGVKRKAVFTNEILYNIISMSIEKYMMGFLTSKNELPPCHTLGNMIKEVKRHVSVSDSLVKKWTILISFNLFVLLPLSNRNRYPTMILQI